MSTLATTRNVLQLIARLRHPFGVDKKRVAEDFEVHPRSISRYIDLLEEIGFQIESDPAGRLHLAEGRAPFRTEDGVVFSMEEADMIKEALINYTDNAPRKREVMEKLYAVTDMDKLSQTISDNHLNRHIHLIKRALKNDHQVILNAYASAHSGTESHRRVEPIRFYNYYRHLVAYEVDSGMTKHFKMDRVGTVTLTGQARRFKAEHEHSPTDVFGMSGPRPIPVAMRLKLRAKNLLCEEFPDARKEVKEAPDGGYRFATKVYALEGVGRFVGGLLDEVELPEDSPLWPYLEEKWRAFRAQKGDKRQS